MAMIPFATPRRSYTLDHSYLDNQDYWRVYCHDMSPSPPRHPVALVFSNEAVVAGMHREPSVSTVVTLVETLSNPELRQVV
jgi:hypothetical protein